DPAAMKSVKEIGRKVIDHLGPNDRMAVVYAVGGNRAADFTGERGRLLAAIDQIPPGLASYTFGWDSVPPRETWALLHRGQKPEPGLDADLSIMSDSIKTLQSIADTMLATPSRRKILVYVGAGVPINTGLAGSPLRSGMRVVNHEIAVQLGDALRDLFREM